MPLSLEIAVRSIRESHFAFPPATDNQLNSARTRGVPEELLAFYALCDGALIGAGNDFPSPIGRRFRLSIPRLADLQTTQSCGYIHDRAPLYQESANWWQIVDYCDGNYLAFDASPHANGRIIDVFHETVGEPGWHTIVASSMSDLLARLLEHKGVYWFDDRFQSLGSI